MTATVIDGKSLVDIQPDEDSVGEMLHDLLHNKSTNFDLYKVSWLYAFSAYHLKDKYVDTSEEEPKLTDYDYVGGEEDFKIDQGYWENEQSNPTSLLDSIERGDYASWAEGGKILIDQMSDEQKLSCIDAGGHIGHTGRIKQTESWKFDKTLSVKLKKDGSNFFELAKRI